MRLLVVTLLAAAWLSPLASGAAPRTQGKTVEFVLDVDAIAVPSLTKAIPGDLKPILALCGWRLVTKDADFVITYKLKARALSATYDVVDTRTRERRGSELHFSGAVLSGTTTVMRRGTEVASHTFKGEFGPNDTGFRAPRPEDAPFAHVLAHNEGHAAILAACAVEDGTAVLKRAFASKDNIVLVAASVALAHVEKVDAIKTQDLLVLLRDRNPFVVRSAIGAAEQRIRRTEGSDPDNTRALLEEIERLTRHKDNEISASASARLQSLKNRPPKP